MERKMKIDFGSGYNPKSGYKTCDVTGSPALDYIYDIETSRIRTNEMFSLILASGSADVIRMKNVLHHVEDYGKLISELFRVLKWGGKLIVIEPTPEAYYSNWCLDNLWYRYVIPRPEIWISPIYRDYKKELTKWFSLDRMIVKLEKEYTITTKKGDYYGYN